MNQAQTNLFIWHAKTYKDMHSPMLEQISTYAITLVCSLYQFQKVAAGSEIQSIE